MMQFIVIFAILSCVVAFVPTTNMRSSSSALSMSDEMSKSLPFLKKPKNLEGLVGNVEFDPLGFSDNFDVKFLREAELKHGRVSMLAVVGWLVQVSKIHSFYLDLI